MKLCLRFGACLATILVACSPCVRANLIINGGFEAPTIAAKNYSITNESNVPGWSTTATDQKIELWSTGFNGVSAYSGNQFIELDANMEAGIYQDISGIAAGMHIDFSFAHRGRASVEAMRLTITDLGSDGLIGTSDDTVMFSKVYSDGTTAWDFYSSATEAPVIAKGHTVRVEFDSLVPGSVGNFLDAVDVTTSPEPGTWAMLSLLSFASFGSGIIKKIRRPIAAS